MDKALYISLLVAVATPVVAFALRLAWKAIRLWHARRLSVEEKHLLHYAAKSQGMIHHMEADQIPGGWVRAGGMDFDTEPRRAGLYLAALERLIALGYVEYKSGNLFTLTHSGWKKGERT
jgi:hypothetical protein